MKSCIGVGAFLVLSSLSTPIYAADSVKTAVAALKCAPADGTNNYNGTCPYPAELWLSDPVYHKAMQAALDEAGLSGLLGSEGVLNGPESPLEPELIAGATWLRGSVCETGNCGNHSLQFLFQPTENKVYGLYHDNGKNTWVGKPDANIAKLLQGEESQQSTSIDVAPDAPPAGTIWEFVGDGGNTLWQVCGGQHGACTIVANTKYYVAVLNRKSARNCAFGDFYIVARQPASWKQYDTGTCSADAYIQKGTINNGQYLSVGISLNGALVSQFPIGYWSMQKEFSGKNRPSWSKAKENSQQQ
ncbi:Ivy family c-type lysozyme inhibitor [Yersinia sp. Marseille-Q3913]|uniref:Ivy family c-type lysozyme inhibitor n=1 Tax=Yersinia sp. Marseille-Q3913 TaxID=2830769 RepID=UPI001BAF18D3|nr:Ivy family c-type lysozyme inhibitor [Yersinia sp. Marseille-Q3913]MBS0054049.1 hypothetical protein [Yersinia sp. Marseille-Q3913]